MGVTGTSDIKSNKVCQGDNPEAPEVLCYHPENMNEKSTANTYVYSIFYIISLQSPPALSENDLQDTRNVQDLLEIDAKVNNLSQRKISAIATLATIFLIAQICGLEENLEIRRDALICLHTSKFSTEPVSRIAICYHLEVWKTFFL